MLDDLDKKIETMWCYKNMSALDISKTCNLTLGFVQKTIKKHSFTRCYHKESWLYQKHIVEKKNTVQMSKEANCSFYSIRDWMKKYDISISKEIANDSKRKYSFNHDFFKTIDTQEKAYWLGFIMADGYVVPNSTGMKISLAAIDKPHLQKMLNSLESDYQIKEYETFLEQTNKSYPMIKVFISSRKFYDNLIDKNVHPSKSNNESIPKIEKEWFKDFIRGYFDGDGCISFYKRERVREHKNQSTKHLNLSGYVSILGGEVLLNWISLYLESVIGLKPVVRKKGKENIHIIVLSDGSMRKFMNWLYEDSTIYLERKYLKYQSYLSLYKTKDEWELKDIVRTSRENLESQAEMSWPSHM